MNECKRAAWSGRTIAGALCAVLLLCSCGVIADQVRDVRVLSAAPTEQETVDGVIWTYYVSDGGAYVGGNTTRTPAVPPDTAGAVSIPASLGGSPVVGIAEYAFFNCAGLTDVTIPNTVTNIGAHAFQNAGALTAVTVPSGVPEIPAYAFQSCSSLTNAVLPAGVKQLGNYAFANCGKLRKVSLPATLKSMGAAVFSGCGALTGMALPDGVESIGERAFQDCTSVTDMLMPSSVTSVGANAFSNCTSITRVTLPGCLTTSRMSVIFPKCYQSITNIVVNDSAKKIAEYAFQNCSRLESVEIANSVTNIGYDAFDKCSGLRSMALPFVGAYRGATGSSANFGRHFGSYSSNSSPVSGCRNICQYYTYSNGTYSDYHMIPTNLVSVTITDETALNYGAFQNCSMLTNVVLNTGVKHLGPYAFSGSGLRSFVVPSSAESIGDYAFSGCVSLGSASISESVKWIGRYAFQNCSSLGAIILPSGIRHVYNYAFSGCSVASMISISDTVTNIAEYAFQNCRCIESVVVPNSVTNIGYGAFDKCLGLRSMVLPFVGAYRGATGSSANFGRHFGSYSSNSSPVSGCRNICQYYTYSNGTSNGTSSEYHMIPTNLVSVTITDETALNYGAFQNCSMLTNVVLNTGVKHLGAYAFSGSGLRSFVVPSSAESIGDYAFSGCVSLGSASISESVKWIGRYAFQNCSSLGAIILPSGIRHVYNYAFSGCSVASTISISDTVTNIAEYAFQNCRCIESVVVPNSVTNIGYGAFDKCTGLRSMVLPFVGAYRGATGSSANFGRHFGSYSSNSSPVSGCRNVCQYYTYSNGAYSDYHMIPTNLVSVTITDETSIGAYAFQNCTMLTEVFWDDGLSEISDYAFSGCIGLFNVKIGAGLKKIGANAFANCGQLLEVVIPDGAENIDQYAFQNCANLRDITIPDSMKSIDKTAFDGCNSELFDTTTVEGLRLVDYWAIGYTGALAGDLDLSGVRGLANSVFSGNTALTSVTLPADMETIGSSAFSGCNKLRRVVMSDGITSIGTSAFSGCSALTDIDIPYSVTNIADYAFQSCRLLTSLELPEGLLHIGQYAFSGCSGLCSVKVPSTLKQVDEYAFDGCSRLTKVFITDLSAWFGIKFGRNYIDPYSNKANPLSYAAASLILNGEQIKDLVVPEDVYTIKNHSFCNCTNLTSVTMHDGVTNVSKSAFCYCSGITNVVLSANLVNIGDYAFDGCRFAEINIPAFVRNIGYGAFYECMALTNAVIPEGVATIGASAFYNCTNLTAITMPSTVVDISESVFCDCSNLKDVSLASSVTNIRASAFQNCRSLTEIELPANLKAIGASAFQGDTGLLRMEIPEGVATIGANAFNGCTNITEIVLPSTLRTIGEYAFYNCSSLASVVIPEGVTSIGQYAFNNCANLSNVTIPQSVTSIGQNAFNGCNSLNVKIADGATAIPNSVFSGCTGLSSVTIPSSVTRIGDNAFYNCTNLTGLVIPSSVKSIGSYAFYGCGKLTDIVIPEGVSSIGQYAFHGCARLKTVTIPKSLKSVGSYAFNLCSNLTAVAVSDLSAWCGISFGNSTANPVCYAHTMFLNGVEVMDLSLPDDVRNVGNYAFYGLANMTNVTFSGAVTNIGSYAFSGCRKLPDVFVPQSVKSIGVYSFNFCSGVTNVVLSSSLTSFATNAFNGCSSVISAVVPGGWTLRQILPDAYGTVNAATVAEGSSHIGSLAFSGCSLLRSVSIPASVSWISENAFSKCPALAAIGVASENSSLYVADDALFAKFANPSNDTNVARTLLRCLPGKAGVYAIPDDVTTIGAWAFEDCGKITGVSIPAGVTALPATSFGGCSSLAAFVVAEGNAIYKDIDGVVFTKDGKTLVMCPPGFKGNYTIPDGVTAIADSAFAGCIHLTGVTFPDSMRKIGTSAFEGCSALSNVDLNGNLDEIGSYAFRDCASLASLAVPDAVFKIGKDTFAGCTALTNLVLPEGLQLAPETLSGTISSTRTLNRGVVYHVTGNLAINSGVTLNIPSGAILKMAPGVSITVYGGGVLNAHGTRSSPIVFTSIKDDSVGGDTNGDGDKTHADKGDWRYVYVKGTANLLYCELYYGAPSNETGIIEAGSGAVNMDGCIVGHALYDGIWNWGGTLNIRNTIIFDCGNAAALYQGTSRFENCVMAFCNTAFMDWSHWHGGTFKNCIFYGCGIKWSDTNSSSVEFQSHSTVANCCLFNPSDYVVQSAQCDGKNGCFYANPLFENPEDGDFRIRSDSPCVDAGDGTVAPETDYFGQTRQTIYENATGKPDGDGNYPDIGIHEVMPRLVANDIDLAVVNVESPETFVVGQKATVSWMVKNLGSKPATGTWSDTVELVCANGAVVPLGTLPVSTELAAGGTRTFSGTFNVPPAQVGAVRVRVTANANRDIFEGTLTANNVAESEAATLTMPELAFSDTGTASFNMPAGGSVGYKLGEGFTEGGLLIVHAASATAGGVKVWSGNGQVPTADIFYASAVEVGGGDYLVRVPAGGDAYVSFANGGSGLAKVEVGVETGAFLLFDTGVVTAPNEGAVSLTLYGNGFADDMEVWLQSASAGSVGRVVPNAPLVVFDSVKAVATFDVTGLAAGTYEVHIKKGGVEDAASLLALTRRKVGPKWSCKLDIASAVRSSREYVGYLEYSNSGDMPLDAPYVKITAGSGSFIRFGTADAWGDTLELMATSETYPASQLKPGETRRIPFRYKTTVSSLSIECGYTQDDPSAFPWDTNASYMRPSWASDELWGLSLAVLKSNVGATWNDYLARMRANCDHVAKIGQPTHRLDRIWQLEINEALGVDHAVSTLASNTDLARSGRGFGLVLSRSYGSGLYRRLRKGIFGYGWSDNYSAYAELQNSGATLALHSGSGSTYLFEKVNGKWTPEDARDKTTCTETSTEYVLTYRSGTVQRIAKDNMRVSSVRDNQGNSLSFTYNADKQLVKVEHCDGQSLSFTYAGGLLVAATDDQGRTTRYEYSGDLLVKVTAFNGLSTQYRYLPADGSVTSRALRQIAYADGTTRDYTYDGAGRVATVAINGNCQTVEIVRKALGSYSVVAPNGGETQVTLGASGEVRETVNALGQKSTRTYTADTLLESVVGPTGKRAKIAYDEDGQAVKATDAAGADTLFGYTSDFGNLAKVTDARGNSFDYGYDKLGRSKTISYADGSVESIAYDDRGNVTNSVNRRGQSIMFTYDNEGNTLSKVWENGRTFTWAYDAKGNCTNATDSATGTVTMEYDENERLVRIVHPKGRGFAYTYDSLGRTISRTTLVGRGDPTAPSLADIQRYEYDSLGRLSRMTDGDGNLYVENAYDETTGWLVTQTYGNGTVVSNAYDILGRTIGIYHGRASSPSEPPIAFFEYAYDAEGRRISQTTAEGIERYTYDTVGQLTDVIYPDGSEEHFTYDAVGNRITANGANYTANNLNQYTAILCASAPLREETMEYDLDGNMTRKSDTHYYYDIQNRLVAVTNETKDIRWSCEYDVFGNRTKVIDHGTAKETLFVQGSLASAVAEYDAEGAVATRHILLGSVRLADLTTNDSSLTTKYYHADGLASTRLITDANGNAIATASYRAFGEVRTGRDALVASGISAGWVGTLGVERDDATGLIFMRNRYYDAEQGRFIQMDPIGQTAGDVNSYRYCKNSSYNEIDVNGCETVYICVMSRPLENNKWSDIDYLASNGKTILRHDQVFLFTLDGEYYDDFGKGPAEKGKGWTKGGTVFKEEDEKLSLYKHTKSLGIGEYDRSQHPDDSDAGNYVLTPFGGDPVQNIAPWRKWGNCQGYARRKTFEMEWNLVKSIFIK